MPTSSSATGSQAAPASGQASADDKAPAEGEELGFDQLLDRLRQVVQKLEQGNLPLEQALKSFEEGVRLSRRGSSILDAAEQRVELLVRDEAGNETRQSLNPASASPEVRPGT